jgi:hypothetical protein
VRPQVSFKENSQRLFSAMDKPYRKSRKILSPGCHTRKQSNVEALITVGAQVIDFKRYFKSRFFRKMEFWAYLSGKRRLERRGQVIPRLNDASTGLRRHRPRAVESGFWHRVSGVEFRHPNDSPP